MVKDEKSICNPKIGKIEWIAQFMQNFPKDKQNELAKMSISFISGFETGLQFSEKGLKI